MSALILKCEQAFDLAQKQLHHLIETYPDQFPMYTVNGKWIHEGEAWTNWCEGFLGGQLWLQYRHSGTPIGATKLNIIRAYLNIEKLTAMSMTLDFYFGQPGDAGMS